MRPFNEKLLEILKTETPRETRLRTDPEEGRRFLESVPEGAELGRREDPLKFGVSVGRRLRYVEWPMHQTPPELMELTYVISGRMTVRVSGGRVLVLRPGDFFLPNHYTVFSVDPLDTDDIAVNYMIKPQFLADVCAQLKSRTVLSEFLLDELRCDVNENRYLHFCDVDDLAVQNLAEAIIFAEFPYMDDEIMLTGLQESPEITLMSMSVLFLSLSKNLDALDGGTPRNFTELLRKSVIDYIDENYRTATLQKLARMTTQSESVLSRQIKSIFGVTFRELLQQKRFDQATELLKHTDLSVNDVAAAVGYENTSFFHSRFRQLYGVSPKDFRNREKESPSGAPFG